MRILAISGSLRRESHNTALLRAAADLLPPGVELEVYDRLREIPPYDEDERAAGTPAPVAHLWQAIEAADAVLVSTPEYNHSLPGQLKNALDWMSRPLAHSPLRNKPAAVVGASTGMFGAVWAQAEARKVLTAIGSRVLDRELPVPSADELLADGKITDDEIEAQLIAVIDALAEAVRERERTLAKVQQAA